MGSAVSASRSPGRFLAALVIAFVAATASASAQEPSHSAELDAAIVRAAKRHGVPEHLVRRIVMRESRYNPRARNHSFWGLMQISYPTARSMGFTGTPEQLLNPVTNLTYAVPYLANAFVAAGKREDAAVRLYASGYYATAKNRGVLGLLRTADSAPMNGVRDEPAAAPTAVADGGWNVFGFGASAPASEPAPAAAAAPQQLAYASASETAVAAPAQAQIQAVAHTLPNPSPSSASDRVAGKAQDDGIAMVPGRDGTMTPPRRWQRDGGTTVITRGEQGVEHVAAYRMAGGAVPRGRHSRKNAAFAQLEASGAAPVAATATDAQPQPTSFYATAMTPAPAVAEVPSQVAAQQAVTRQDAARAAADGAAAAPSSDASNPDGPAAKGKHRTAKHRHVASGK